MVQPTPLVSKDDLLKLVKKIVRRSTRSRAGATMLERKILSLLDAVRQDHKNNLSVTDDTVASIAVSRIVASLLQHTDHFHSTPF